MKIFLLPVLLWCVIGAVLSTNCSENKKLSTSKLVCYYSTVEDDVNGCYCTHIILPANSDVKAVEKLKERSRGAKVYVSVNEFNQGLIDLLKTHKIDGLELNLKKLDSKNDISDFISTIKTKIGNDLDVILSVPAKADLVAKYFDFKALSKHVDLFVLETAFLGASSNVTFHPSRLSGMWDMQNTDSVVDLISGLGAPLSKLVIAAPVQAFQFTLQNEEYTAPGSPALELQTITRNEFCRLMQDKSKNWTLERDEDQAGPYIFSKNQWVAFEDAKSIDIKVKYSKIRGLAGVALKDLIQDGADCGSSILEATYNGLSRQARAPRGAVLHSLEREIVDGLTNNKPLDSVQLSPYKISRIIDTEGKIHVVRQDTRTEFQCSRQGYFVHPRSCNRFYRCVKFDQQSDNYNVFEFDCPAGLAFDERVEVCVWPGSLPHGTPCSGSSEIAPVPRQRFECPSEPGYYADPENCRWFFACLDHGKSPLSAYEFRCPYGLVFDEDRLVCEWPWLVPKCGVGFEYYSNNAIKGSPQSAGVILENYNGLGQLGAIKLGGLSGKIQKPIATVYSNVVGQGGLSYKTSQALENAGLLRVNNGVGFHGAVLVNQGTDGQYGQSGNLVQNGAGIGYQSAVLVNQGTDGQYGQSGNLVQNGIGYQDALLVNQGTDGQYGQSGKSVQNGYQGAVLVNQGIGQYGQSGNLAQNGDGIGYQGAVLVNQGTGQYGQSAKLVQNGAVSSQSITQYHGANQQAAGVDGRSILINAGQERLQSNSQYDHTANSGQGNIFIHNSGALGLQQQNNAALSSQSFNQFHGLAGNINIIGGGYSIVGTPSNVDIPGNENDVSLLGSVSSAPAVPTPIVTAVPVPGIKSVSGFETIQGGVIANIPEYQYKVQSLQDAGIFANISSSFANVVVSDASIREHLSKGLTAALNPAADHPHVIISSTNRPTIIEHQNVYSVHQQQPVIVESHQPTSTPSTYSYSKNNAAIISKFSIRKPTIIEDYTYQKPLYQQPQLLSTYTYQPPVQKQPVTQYTYQNVVQNAPVHAYSYQPTGGSYQYVNVQNKQQDGGYVYEKPSVSFEETLSSKTAQSAQSQENSGFYSNQGGYSSTPQSTVQYSTPRPVEAQQPAISSYFNVATSHGNSEQGQQAVGYTYSKPAVKFEDISVVSSTPKPLQPAIVTSYFNAGSTKAHNAVEQQNVGYTYPRPEVKFEEAPVVYSTPKPVQPAVVTSYYNIGSNKAGSNTVVEQKNTGYSYPQPGVKFEEAPVVYSTPKPVQPAIVTSYYNSGSSTANVDKQNIGYAEVNYQEAPVVYSTPKPVQPAVVTSYYKSGSTKTDSNVVEQQNIGYSYAQPEVKFVEAPVVYSTLKPVQPAVVTSYYNIGSSKADSNTVVEQENVGYAYPRPEVRFEEAPVVYSTPKSVQPTIVTSYYNSGSSKADSNAIVEQQNTGYSYPRPEEAPVVYSTPKPVQPAVVTSYYRSGSTKAGSNAVVEQKNIGYSYSQPEIKFEEAPVVYSTPKPIQPAIVTSYYNSGSTKADSNTVEQQNIGYAYPRPEVKFEEAPVAYSTPKPLQPAVVTSYYNIGSNKANVDNQNIGYAYHKPEVNYQVYSTPKPVQPAVVTSYYKSGSTKADFNTIVEQQNSGYSYPRPEIKFVDAPVVYSTPKPAVVSSYYNTGGSNTIVEQQNSGYSYPQPEIKFIETPVAYSTPKPLQPAIVTSYYKSGSTKANSNTFVEQQNVGYSYPRPEEIPVIYSTPKPTQPAIVTSYYNTGSNQVNSETLAHQQNIGYIYQQPAVRFEETPAVYSTPKTQYSTPQSAVVSSYFNIGSSTPNYISSTSPQPNVVVEELPKPVQELPFVKKTAYVTGQRPTVVENYEYPNYEKVFGQKTLQQPYIIQSTPKPTFVSTIRTIARKKLRPASIPAYVTSTPAYISSTITSRPISKYSFSSADDEYQYQDIVKSTTVEPVRTYLPVTSTVKYTSALPKRTRTKVVEEYLAPSRNYLPKVTTEEPEITTLSREYLPIRTRLRIATTGSPKVIKPVTVIKQNDAHPLLSAKLGAQCTCVSNTLKLRKNQKIIIVEEDEDDDGYVVKDSYQYEPAKVVDITPQPVTIISTLKPKRVKQPSSRVSEAAFLHTNVDTGTQKALSKHQFDRYGPGGLRGKSETLQGTIDCQRAGLFRHPTQCNKFYACRWDCTKNRFTLHVFNCPVHLTFDNSLGACNWPSQGPACVENTLITSD